MTLMNILSFVNGYHHAHQNYGSLKHIALDSFGIVSFLTLLWVFVNLLNFHYDS